MLNFYGSFFTLIKVLLSCSRMSSASCDTLWHNTDAISININIRRACNASPRPVNLLVSDLPPQAVQALWQSLMGHYGVKIIDNREKIDFKQTIIHFQEKTILKSLDTMQIYDFLYRVVFLNIFLLFFQLSHYHIFLQKILYNSITYPLILLYFKVGSFNRRNLSS